MTDWADIDSFCVDSGFYDENPIQDIIRRQDRDVLPVPRYDEQTLLFDAAPFGLVVSDESSQMERSLSQESENSVRGTVISDTESRTSQKLSTDQILRLAGERFIKFSSEKFINIDMFEHPYGSSLSLLSTEDKQDVELSQLLLAAAEKVSNKQFERARKLLTKCREIALCTGTPVQRTVFYFAEALMERINRETGKCSQKERNPCDACLKGSVPAVIRMYRNVPFNQVLHLTAVQTILENITGFSKVHIIDFHLMTGLHWAALMKSMTEQITDQSCYLKITAVVTEDKHRGQETEKLLQSFARHLNLPFSYNTVSLTNIMDLKEEDFDIKPDEGMAIFFPFKLRTLVSHPVCLRNLMKVIKKIKPSVIVVEEVESNHNSPSFVNRFIEALFFYGALFDSLDESTTRNDVDRMALESGVYMEALRDIVVKEGIERGGRSVCLKVWRAFFTRCGMIELELSTSSLSQAKLILNEFPCGESCTLDLRSKSLFVGWKGTPLYSLSAWKFH